MALLGAYETLLVLANAVSCLRVVVIEKLVLSFEGMDGSQFETMLNPNQVHSDDGIDYFQFGTVI